MNNYDSRPDTYQHIQQVQFAINLIIHTLLDRARKHDQSKLQYPEKEVFDRETPKLKGLTYGSPEYKESTERLGEALKHHYENNRHHPEHFENGIDDMNLVDVIEMFCDWHAATMRHEDGDILKSIKINKERFGMSDQLAKILENTAKMSFDDIGID